MHGIVETRSVGKDVARSRVAAGRWQRVHPGVLCTYTGPLTFESRCEAALRYAGDGAALDGATAATLHGLPGFGRDVVELVVPHGRRLRRQPGLVVRRSRTLDEEVVLRRAGLRVVTVERAVLLLGPGAIAAAVQQGLTTTGRLRRCLAGMGHLDGRKALAEALDDVEGGSRSWLESRFLRLVRAAGLPPPALNHPLTVGGRRVRADACYFAERVVVELDGRAYHVMSGDWEDDLARQNLLVLAGWTVLRFTARDLRERPDEVVAALRHVLRGNLVGR